MYTEIFIGRQPIFKKNGQYYGYELLYRGKEQENSIVRDDAQVTARVIINTIHNIGFEPIISDKLGFINVDDHTLLSDALLSLPHDRFIIEILEYTKISVAVVERIQHLHELGYRFAIDDFHCTQRNLDYFKPIFPYVDIVKVDLLITHAISIEEMKGWFSKYDVALLAEKVENMEMFERCSNAGFEYFQGYFFEKPVLISGNRIEPAILNVIDLINTFYATSNIDILTQRFSLYPDLTFNLLRYVNSSAFNFKHEIASIKQILVLLGPSRLRSWLGLFLYAGSDNAMFQEALLDAAKFRAKIMYYLVQACGKPQLADEAFLTGSLSLIDIYLKSSMESLLERIQLSQAIMDALLLREGYLGKLLSVSEKLETTENIQMSIEELAPEVQLTPHDLYTIYLNANTYVEKTK